MLGESLVTTAWCVLQLKMEGQAPAVEDSCKYIEYAAVDKRQGLVLQLAGWAWDEQPFIVKNKHVNNNE
jgi:hypothetical protein